MTDEELIIEARQTSRRFAAALILFCAGAALGTQYMGRYAVWSLPICFVVLMIFKWLNNRCPFCLESFFWQRSMPLSCPGCSKHLSKKATTRKLLVEGVLLSCYIALWLSEKSPYALPAGLGLIGILFALVVVSLYMD